MSDSILQNLFWVLVCYPLIGAVGWTIGGIYYRYFYSGRNRKFQPIAAAEQPMVSIMIPAHNEEVMIEETIEYLMNELNYENYEVLVCDDGSYDMTSEILASLAFRYSNLRVLHVEKNKGKAHAFNIGISFCKGEFVLSNDADTVPEPDALIKYMNYFMDPAYQNCAGVTANMDVQNRSLLLEKSQTVEFSSIVGIIKRSQLGLLGSMYAYSGANTMYRKAAVYDAGLFRQDRATEDISIAWDHQLNGWQALFDPDIMFYMNVPSTLEMLYKQRKRWAKGGIEVYFTNFFKVFKHPLKHISQVVMMIDQTGSILWSFLYCFGLFYMLFRFFWLILSQQTDALLHYVDMIFVFYSFMAIVGSWQLFAALVMDNHAKKLKYLFFAPVYMLWYWQVNTLTIITTFLPALKAVMGLQGEGTWVSPTRTKMKD
ncbi:glycosyltransferase family 2 protein [Lactococcus ileimucosae]|uniref:Glycosyltransferase family 2 protein n=1 Tax=Lactococcus ileimucosae TaxID=2941329 RepID=A0ABV4D285_9LACT